MEIPQLGFGTWLLPVDSTKEMVLSALNKGYTHIDCALVYENERQVGEAFAEFFKTHDRSKYWITTKLWNTNHHPDNVRKQLEGQLKELQLDYVDLFIIHWPVQFKHGDDLFPRVPGTREMVLEYGYGIQDTWGAMEKLVDSGLAKHIGVSNFCVALLNDMLSYCRHKPYTNQIEIHPHLQQDVLVQYCIDNNIHVTAYSPLGGAYNEQSNYKLWLEDKEMQAMCKKHGKSLAQVILRWHVQKWPKMYSVIPKSGTAARIGENKDFYDF